MSNIVKAAVGKIFHHRIHGARFIMPNGQEISFAGGSFNTSGIADAEVRAAVEHELTKVADQASSMIYTNQPVADMAQKQAVAEVTAAATSAFDGENKTPPGTVTVPMPMAPTPKPVLHEAAAVETADNRTLAQKIEDAKSLVAGNSVAKKP